MLRAIHLFPEFPNTGVINALRMKYDPLVNLIPPHVTLVFPFESDISLDSLIEHIKQVSAEFRPFRVAFRGVTGAENEYLFLNMKVGNDQVIALHDKLYTGLLQQYLNRSLTYTPHVTVGRMKDRETFELALAETEAWNQVFETTIREVVLEHIDGRGHPTTECKVRLLP